MSAPPPPLISSALRLVAGLSPGPCPLPWARSGHSVGDTDRGENDGENDGLLDGLLALDGVGLALRDGLLKSATSFGSAGRSSSELSVSASLPLAAASTAWASLSSSGRRGCPGGAPRGS